MDFMDLLKSAGGDDSIGRRACMAVPFNAEIDSKQVK